jgi:hypothetical protein
MEIQQVSTSSLIPYSLNNVKHPESQVDRIANSIKEFGFNVPIVVNGDNIVIAGHGRLLAAKKLGLDEVPVVRVENLTPAQEKAYRILDNKLTRDSEWDFENLAVEFDVLKDEGFDLEAWGLETLVQAVGPDAVDNSKVSLDNLIENDLEDTSEEEREEISKYSSKIDAPIYVPRGDRPSENELSDLGVYESLIEDIDRCPSLTEEQKNFLRLAATRHIVFNYQSIAEYYAHAELDLQRLMEDSALVIIDFNKAIEKGFVVLTKRIAEQYAEEYGNESREE